MPTYKFDTTNHLTLQQLKAEKPEIEPAFESVEDTYNLSFAFLMLPRFGNHKMVGDVVEYLYSWMQMICVSYGWKLEEIDIQPEYMQWVASVPFTVAPAQIVRIVRQQTSMNLFDEFPRYKKENVGNDFWARAHLVIVGNRLHSEKTIREFIDMTRRHQAGLHRTG